MNKFLAILIIILAILVGMGIGLTETIEYIRGLL